MIYKIISKVLATRLNKLIDKIISPSQSAFMPGHLLGDNFFIGFECLHAINSKNRWKVSKISLKLDMSKAYDRI